VPVAAAAPVRAGLDDALVRILGSSVAGETIAMTFERRERELIAVLGALTVTEARAVHARLARPRASDAVATAFTRLVADRRGRIVAFLADARRREALALAARR